MAADDSNSPSTHNEGWRQKGIDGSLYDKRAIRTAQHKLILRKFDVPGESRNLFAKEPCTFRGAYKLSHVAITLIAAVLIPSLHGKVRVPRASQVF